MPERAHLRVRHLRRLTDRIGLLSCGGDWGEPDAFSGYDTRDNAQGLRLAAYLNEAGIADDADAWAATYLQFMFQSLRSGQGFRAHREAMGTWTDEVVEPKELASVVWALAVASNSELPGVTRDRANALWNIALPFLATVRCPRTAARWLIAIAARPPAEQRKLEAQADRLARRLVENAYYPLRSSEWEWFDQWFLPGDACLPHGLWAAYSILGEQRYARVAAVTTDFLIEHLFEDGLFVPVGSRGTWPRHGSKAVFDQYPDDVAATVELLGYAHDVAGERAYTQYAEYAHAWFTGNNVKGISMVDDTTEGVFDALTLKGHTRGQSARAIVSFLLSAATLRRTHAAHAPVMDLGTVVSLR